MAGAVRIEYEGAIYHVFSRRHRGDSIYKSEKDRIEILALRYHTDLSLKEIGESMEMVYATVSRAVYRFVEEMESDKEIKSMVEAINRRLRWF